ncbi:uncharacterized protein LOC135946064 [Cloeon dipterum]|uniref:uncharacterized protein LOC135946064 n=1 Tax=Cloeon dipterum TaxID=197152 RepID=UPI00321F6B09
MSALLALREFHLGTRLLANKVAFEAAKCMTPMQNKSSKINENSSCKKESNNEDSMDSFVNNLVSIKSETWKNKMKNKRIKIFSPVKIQIVPEEDGNLTKKHKTYPISLIKLSIDGEKFDHEEMLRILESPEILSKVDHAVLKSLALTFIKMDFVEGIFQLESTCHRLPIPPMFDFIGSLFKSYLATNQVAKALQVVEQFYVRLPNSRREARSHLASIIKDVVSKHSSDALLVQCKQLALRLNRDFADSRPVIFLWHACFISEWFSDQQVARELLAEISRSRTLVETFSKKLMTATYTALGRDRPDLVQDLIQDLISNNLRAQLTIPMRLLFDYRCDMGDLRGCAAIMKSTVDLKVVLTSKQHQEFLELMTLRKHYRWKSPAKRSRDTPPNTEQFKFKF